MEAQVQQCPSGMRIGKRAEAAREEHDSDSCISDLDRGLCELDCV